MYVYEYQKEYVFRLGPFDCCSHIGSIQSSFTLGAFHTFLDWDTDDITEPTYKTYKTFNLPARLLSYLQDLQPTYETFNLPII